MDWVRLVDHWFITYFLLNLSLVVLVFDVAIIFCPDPNLTCSILYISEENIKQLYDFAKENDQVMYHHRTWYLVTLYFGLFLWGPYYLFAIYGFIKKRNWIRIPTIIYSSILLFIMTQGISEQIWGEFQTTDIVQMFQNNLMHIVTPILLLIRMSDQPFD